MTVNFDILSLKMIVYVTIKLTTSLSALPVQMQVPGLLLPDYITSQFHVVIVRKMAVLWYFISTYLIEVFIIYESHMLDSKNKC